MVYTAGRPSYPVYNSRETLLPGVQQQEGHHCTHAAGETPLYTCGRRDLLFGCHRLVVSGYPWVEEDLQTVLKPG